MIARLFIISILLLTADLGFASDCAVYEGHLHWRSTLKSSGIEYWEKHAKAESLILTLTSDNRLLISDVSNPDLPISAAEMSFPSGGHSVWSRGSTAFVECILDGLLVLAVLDIQDPQQPVITQTIPLDAWISDLGFQENQVVYALNNRTMAIYEITSPGNLQHLNTISTDYQIRDLEFHAGLVYAGTEEELIISDFSDPMAPVELNNIPGYCLDMVFDGNIMMKTSSYPDNRLRSYDVSDPLVPTLLDELQIPNLIESIDLSAGLAVVATPYPTSLYSVSLDGKIDFISEISQRGVYGSRTFFDEENLFYCNDAGINIMELGNSLPTPLKSSTFIRLGISSIELKGDFAFLAYYSGLKVYDLSDPFEPALAGSLTTTHSLSNIEIQDNHAFVLKNGEMTAIDISDPTIPQAVGTLTGLYNGYIRCTALADNTLWIYHDWTNLEAVDVSDPSNPQLQFSMEWDHIITDMEVVGDLLHVVDRDGDYRIYSTTTFPPSEIAVLNVSNWATGVSVQDNLALVGCLFYGAALVDISEPDAPVLLTHHSLTENTSGVLLKDNLALIGSETSLQVLDVSNPQFPVSVGTVLEEAHEPRMLDNGGILVWSEYFQMMNVLHHPCEMLTMVEIPPVASEVQLSIYPNPFNPSTTIVFNIKQAGLVGVAVYDLSGRRIRTLYSGLLEVGAHETVWDGRNEHDQVVASGMYLVQLESPRTVSSRRVVLLK
ncbi:MAG: T9SS type A sorting domain-containing protein [Gemmatimonadales bacterium]|nr:T9SS type A sorting domain-containing protein [Gemmatimonadales bacterium]